MQEALSQTSARDGDRRESGLQKEAVETLISKAARWLMDYGSQRKRYPPPDAELVRLQEELVERAAYLERIEQERHSPGAGKIPEVLIFSDAEGNISQTRALLDYAEVHQVDTVYSIGDVIARGPGGHAILDELGKRMERLNVRPLHGANEAAFMAAMMGVRHPLSTFFLSKVGGGGALLKEVGASPENFRYHPALLKDLEFIRRHFVPYAYDLFHGVLLGRDIPINPKGQLDASYLGTTGSAAVRKIGADMHESRSWKGLVISKFLDLIFADPSRFTNLLEYLRTFSPEQRDAFFSHFQIRSRKGREITRVIIAGTPTHFTSEEYRHRILGVGPTMDRVLVMGREGIYWIQWNPERFTYEKQESVVSREAYLNQLESLHWGWIEAHLEEIEQRIRADELAQRHARFEKHLRWLRDDASLRMRGLRYDLFPEYYLDFMNEIYRQGWYVGRNGILQRGDSDVSEEVFLEYKKLFDAVDVEAVYGVILLSNKTGKAFYLIGDEKENADQMDVPFVAWKMLQEYPDEYTLLADDITRAFVLGTKMFGGTLPLKHIGESHALDYRNREGVMVTPYLGKGPIIPREGFYEISHVFYINHGSPSKNSQETRKKLFRSQSRRGHHFSRRFVNDAIEVRVHEVQVPDITEKVPYGMAGGIINEGIHKIVSSSPKPHVSPIRRLSKIVGRALLPRERGPIAPTLTKEIEAYYPREDKERVRDGGVKRIEEIAEVTNPLGLHVRPSGAIAKIVNASKSEVLLIHEKTGQVADASNIMEILILAAPYGTEIKIIAEGEDAEEVVAAIQEEFKTEYEPRKDGGSKSIEEVVTITNFLGLHMRLAAEVVKAAHRFKGTKITLKNVTEGNREADARSIMSVMMLTASQGHQIHIRVEGENPKGVMEAVKRAIYSEESPSRDGGRRRMEELRYAPVIEQSL